MIKINLEAPQDEILFSEQQIHHRESNTTDTINPVDTAETCELYSNEKRRSMYDILQNESKN